MDKLGFIELLLESHALKFGDFTTKSGRQSPYFVNVGSIATGKNLGKLADYYFEAYEQYVPADIDHIYGPAYKGISLSVLLAERVYVRLGRDLKVSYNRKEVKGHGEGGQFIGANLEPGAEVYIIEDILTGGTSIRESINFLKLSGVKVRGALVGIDRMEKGVNGDVLAKDEIEQEFGFPVHAIINVAEIVESLKEKEVLGRVWLNQERLTAMHKYLSHYGSQSFL
ncbi:MAG: orotate phosphoribosyltransferase [Oligoflexales bacterium]